MTAHSHDRPTDLGPLSWCIGEIRHSLKLSLEALQKALPPAGDKAALNSARVAVHQALGALRVVAISGVPLLLEEVEKQIDTALSAESAIEPNQLLAIGQAYQAVTEYLSDLLEGRAHQPVVLYPQYRNLLELRNADRNHPADLFFPDVRVKLKRTAPNDRPDAEQVSNARSIFERALLAHLRDPVQVAALNDMAGAIDLIDRANADGENGTFWAVLAALFKGIKSGSVIADIYSKRVVAKINLQVRKMLNEGQPASERILIDVLFLLARANNDEPSVAAVRKAFVLDGTVPEDFDQLIYGVIDADVLIAAKESAAQARQTWEQVASGARDEVPVFMAAVNGLGTALKKLPSTGLIAIAQAFGQAAQKDFSNQSNEQLAMEVAIAILYVEHSLEMGARLSSTDNARALTVAQRLVALISGAKLSSNLPDWLSALVQRAQDRETVAQFVIEIESNMHSVESTLDAYFRDCNEVVDLPQLAGQMQQVSGALNVLGYQAAASGAAAIGSKVKMLAIGVEPDADLKSSIARSLGSIGFFVEALSRNDNFSDRCRFDSATGEFVIDDVKPVVHEAVIFEMPDVQQPVTKAVPEIVAEAVPEADVFALDLPGLELPALPVKTPDLLVPAFIAPASFVPAALAVPALVAAIAPAPAAAPKTETLVELEVDPEILEIFLLEVQEVLETIASNSDTLRVQPASNDAMTTIRRAFHTLKGSGRMVGLTQFGEAGWGMEQTLNLWLGEKRPASSELLRLIDSAHGLFSSWVAQLAVDIRTPIDPVPLSALAQKMRDGQQLIEIDWFSLNDSGAPSSDVNSDFAFMESEFTDSQFADALDLDPSDALMLDTPIGQSIAFEFDLPAAVEPELLEPTALIDEFVFEEAFLEPTVEAQGVTLADETIHSDGLVFAEVSAFDESAFVEHDFVQAAEVHVDTFSDDAALVDVLQVDAAQVDAVQVEALPVLEEAVFESFVQEPEPLVVSFNAPPVVPFDASFAAAFAVGSAAIVVPSFMDARQNSEPELTQSEVVPPVFAEPILIEPVLAEPVPVQPVLAAASVKEDTSFAPTPMFDAGDELRSIFLSEADDLLTAIANQASVWELTPAKKASDATKRAMHSLAGSSAIMGLDQVHTIALSMENFLQLQMSVSRTLNPTDVTDTRYIADRLAAMLHRFAAGQKQTDEAGAVTRSLELHKRWLDGVTVGNTDDNSALVNVSTSALIAAVATATAQAAQVPAFVEQKAVQVGALASDELDADLAPIFIEEAMELLPEVGDSLRQLAKTPSNQNITKLLMRQLHTIKGSARMAGAMRMGQVVHDMETRVEAAMGMPTVPAALIDDMQSQYDIALNMFEVIRDPALASSQAHVPQVALPEQLKLSTEPLDEAEAFVAPNVSAKTDVVVASNSALMSSAATPHEVVQINQTVRVRAETLDRLVNEAGEVSISRSRVENHVGLIRTSLTDLTDNVNRLRAQLREIEIQAESQITSQVAASRNETHFDPLEFDRFTRFQELTRMMAESVNDVATVQQNMLRNLNEVTLDVTRQSQLTRDLQQGLMSVRMVQFTSVSDRLYRVVRLASKESDKRVNLDIRGGSVDIDRSVLERIIAPLEHLLRNCVSHGIESREARIAVGKSETGEIAIQIRQEGNEVVISVSDDGAGLNFSKIRARAEAAGLLKPNEAYSQAELAEMIFMPGFSTAAEVTTLAGRGVGMDVVRAETTALGGRVETTSETNKGSIFTLHLPASLAITQVVLMSAGEYRFSVPSVLVEQVLQFKPQQLASAYSNRTIQWQNKEVGFLYMGSLLELSDATPVAQRYSPVVILRSSNQQLAVHVDAVLGNQEVVVKNVGPQLARLNGITGATILGDGEIVLIMNPVQLAHAALAKKARTDLNEPSRSISAMQMEAALRAPATVMVVDDSLTVRKVTQRLLTREGYQSVLAKDGVDGLRQLQDQLPDVILLDVEMPRMDGFDFTRAVRADARTKNIPIIMITSRTADKHRNHAMSLGVNVFLGKPYGDVELLGHIKAFLEARKSKVA
jgi:chemosensory pili system protein ChpA (sensor histidine kinase/response regulator)